jgi:hypothetical protein
LSGQTFPPEAPEGRRDEAPTWIDVALKYFGEFCRPGYHVRRIREDFRASRHALQNRDLLLIMDDRESLAKALRGRFFAAYFMVGPFGLVGPLLGWWLQVTLHNYFAGTIGTIVGGNLGSLIGFQLVWWFSNTRFYANGRQHLSQRLADFERDVLPIQWDGFRGWLTLNAFLLPIVLLLTWVLQATIPKLAPVVPMSIVVPTLEIALLHGALIRVMGDIFERHSVLIADRHIARHAA